MEKLHELFYSMDGHEAILRFWSKNNEIIWVNCKTKPYYNEHKIKIGYIGTAIEITALKNSEHELQKFNNYFEKAGQMAKIGSFNFDILNNKIYWSKVTKEIHEVPENYETNLATAIYFYEESHRALIEKAVTQAIENGISYDLELKIVTKKGNIKWVRTTGKPEFYQDKCIRLSGTFQDINKEKLNEEKLETERIRLKNVLKGMHAGSWEWNIQTGKTTFDSIWAELIGYDLKDLEPTTINTWDSLLHPDDKTNGEAKLNQHFNGKTEIYEAEYRLKHKKGHWIWILDRGKVFKWDEAGKPLLMAGTHQDITKRKEAEIQLKKFSKAMEQSPASIVITNLKGEIEYVNPYFSKITGYSFEEALGQNPRILKSGDKDTDTYKQLWNTISKGETWYGEFKNVKKNGELYWESASISPLQNELGEITNYIAVKEEITNRKQTEDLLKQSEHKYRTLIEQSPFGMAVINEEGVIEFSNKKIHELTGYDLKQLKYVKSWMELVYPDPSYREHLLKERERLFTEYLLKGKPTEPIEVEVLTAWGEKRILELTYIALGKYFVAVFSDITERHQYINKLKNQNQLLEEIAWIQSHVIRAPLARLMSLFEIWQEKDFTIISEEAISKHIKNAMDELDTKIREISNKAYLLHND